MLPKTPAEWSTFVTIALLVLLFWLWITRKPKSAKRPPTPHPGKDALWDKAFQPPAAPPVLTHALVNFEAGDRVAVFIPGNLDMAQAQAIRAHLETWVKGDDPVLVLSDGVRLEIVRPKGAPVAVDVITPGTPDAAP